MSRARLLDSAAQLFAERGYHTVTVDDIAETAGISRGSIFWHFGTKEQLLHRVVDETILVWGREGLAAEVGELRGLAAIDAALRSHRRLVRTDPRVFRLHHLHLAEALGPLPELAPVMVDMHRRVRALVSEWIDQAVADDEIPPVGDSAAAAASIVGAVSGLVGHWLLDSSGIDLDAAYDHLAQMIRAGLGARRRMG